MPLRYARAPSVPLRAAVGDGAALGIGDPAWTPDPLNLSSVSFLQLQSIFSTHILIVTAISYHRVIITSAIFNRRRLNFVHPIVFVESSKQRRSLAFHLENET